MTDIAIEVASREHLAAIPAIELAAATLFSEADLPTALRYRVTDNRDLCAAAESGRLWVALAGREGAVGFAMADVVDGNAHLDEIDVLPGYARQGIGTRLLAAFLAWARAERFPAATLITFAHLPWNAPFYARHGFVTLAGDERGRELEHLVWLEGRAGLSLARRICMKLELSPG